MNRKKNTWMILVTSVLMMLVASGTVMGFVVIEPETQQESLLINISQRLNLTGLETIMWLELFEQLQLQYNETINATIIQNVTQIIQANDTVIVDAYTKSEIDSKINLLLSEHKKDFIIINELTDNLTDDTEQTALEFLVQNLSMQLAYQKQLSDLEKMYLSDSTTVAAASPGIIQINSTGEVSKEDFMMLNVKLNEFITGQATGTTTQNNQYNSNQFMGISNQFWLVIIIIAIISYLYYDKVQKPKKSATAVPRYNNATVDRAIRQDVQQETPSVTFPTKAVKTAPKSEL